MMFLITYGQFCETASPPLRGYIIYIIFYCYHIEAYVVLLSSLASNHKRTSCIVLFSYRHNYCINVFLITTT